MQVYLSVSDGSSVRHLRNQSAKPPFPTSSRRTFHKGESWRGKHRRSNSSFMGRDLQCRHCSATFQNHFSLADHTAVVHLIEMPFKCDICGKGYLTSSGRNLHMETHTGKSYMCPICDSKFTQKGTIKMHLKSIHHMAQCPSCLAVFRLGQEYNRHVLHCHS